MASLWHVAHAGTVTVRDEESGASPCGNLTKGKPDACMLLLVLFPPLHSGARQQHTALQQSLAAASAAACGGCAARRLRAERAMKSGLDGLKAKTAVFTITRCLLKQPTIVACGRRSRLWSAAPRAAAGTLRLRVCAEACNRLLRLGLEPKNTAAGCVAV